MRPLFRRRVCWRLSRIHTHSCRAKHVSTERRSVLGESAADNDSGCDPNQKASQSCHVANVRMCGIITY